MLYNLFRCAGFFSCVIIVYDYIYRYEECYSGYLELIRAHANSAPLFSMHTLPASELICRRFLTQCINAFSIPSLLHVVFLWGATFAYELSLISWLLLGTVIADEMRGRVNTAFAHLIVVSSLSESNSVSVTGAVNKYIISIKSAGYIFSPPMVSLSECSMVLIWCFNTVIGVSAHGSYGVPAFKGFQIVWKCDSWPLISSPFAYFLDAPLFAVFIRCQPHLISQLTSISACNR